MRVFTIILLFILVSYSSVFCQELKTIRKTNGAFYEEYTALKEDVSIKNGRYIRKYKDFIIEQGAYSKGEKTGRWAYFSLEGYFEFEYDYTNHKVVRISDKNNPEEYVETPVLFHGSPIIPYLYMVSHINYPVEAKTKDITGKVVLAIGINQRGQITSLFIKEKLHPLLDKEVMKVAKTFPNNWEWIPATYNGQNINSEYLIDIEFELISGHAMN